MDMHEFIRTIPKAELHLHLEGTLELDTLLKIAERNNIELPYSEAVLRSRRESFTCFDDFAEDYRTGCLALKNSDDYYDIAIAYFKKVQVQGVKYAELYISNLDNPAVSVEILLTGLIRAKEEAERTLGVASNFILHIVRHISVEQNLKLLHEAAQFKEHITGIGMAGCEVGHPATDFIEVLDEAKRLGLCGPDGNNITIHLGEEGDALSIIEGLYAFRPKRIDHGVRCLENQDLVNFLAKHAIPLLVSPLSNKCLQVLDRFFNGRNIVRDLIDAGLVVTINSDDPAFFEGYVHENFLAIVDSLGDQEEEKREKVAELCKNSFRASFLSKREKDEYITLIDRFLESN